MIIDLHEKYNVDPKWFEEQCKRDPEEAWSERLCELLSVYRVKDSAVAKEVADRIKMIIENDEKLEAVME